MQQFLEREVPGYTRTVVLRAHADAPAEEVSRRIDWIFVSLNLLCYGTSMFTTPVGFSDHRAVVLRFVGLGLSGRQPNRWKLPREALRDPEVVDWMAARLAEVRAQGHQGLAAFEASYDVLCAGSSLYYSCNPPSSPEYLRVHALLRQTCADYVPPAGFSVLRSLGVRPLTMCDAYVGLMKVVCAQRGAEQLDKQYQRVHDVLQTEESMMLARKWRAKAVLRLMLQLQDRRVYSALRARNGHLVRDRTVIARELVSYWSGLMIGGTKSEEECYAWLQRRGLPSQWRTLGGKHTHRAHRVVHRACTARAFLPTLSCIFHIFLEWQGHGGLRGKHTTTEASTPSSSPMVVVAAHTPCQGRAVGRGRRGCRTLRYGRSTEEPSAPQGAQACGAVSNVSRFAVLNALVSRFGALLLGVPKPRK